MQTRNPQQSWHSPPSARDSVIARCLLEQTKSLQCFPDSRLVSKHLQFRMKTAMDFYCKGSSSLHGPRHGFSIPCALARCSTGLPKPPRQVATEGRQQQGSTTPFACPAAGRAAPLPAAADSSPKAQTEPLLSQHW